VFDARVCAEEYQKIATEERRKRALKQRIERHVQFHLESLRQVYRGPVVWRTGWMPQWSAFRPSGGPADDAAYLTVIRLYLSASDSVLSSFGDPENLIVRVSTQEVVEGWANATVDNAHFDGGILREHHRRYEQLREQPVTPNLLNTLLNAIGALEARVRQRGTLPPKPTGVMAACHEAGTRAARAERSRLATLCVPKWT